LVFLLSFSASIESFRTYVNSNHNGRDFLAIVRSLWKAKLSKIMRESRDLVETFGISTIALPKNRTNDSNARAANDSPILRMYDGLTRRILSRVLSFI